jgi:predicted site-specific integrase-resolvase
MKIRLDEWLKREFYPPPAIRTARLWVQQGKIFPPPIKVGRAYYVEEGAKLKVELERPLRLAERICGVDEVRKMYMKNRG